jgi:hypothetical protein
MWQATATEELPMAFTLPAMDPDEKHGDYELRIMRTILPNVEYNNTIGRPAVSVGTGDNACVFGLN